jgi:hypothetical protein
VLVCYPGVLGAPPRGAGGPATRALADGVAALTADDVLGLHADSASPMPRPSAEMPAILVTRAKCSKFIVIPLIVPMDQA